MRSKEDLSQELETRREECRELRFKINILSKCVEEAIDSLSQIQQDSKSVVYRLALSTVINSLKNNKDKAGV